MTCTCSRLRVGMELTEHRNWNPDCEEHGVGSEWYTSEEQVESRAAQNRRLREMYALANLRRSERAVTVHDYFLDTEFLDTGNRLELISLGLVDLGGAEYYAESSEFDWDDPEVTDWLREHVRPHLRGGEFLRIPGQIRTDLKSWVGRHPRFWSYFSSHDWVLVCNLFGGLMSLPGEWPQLCLDLEQVRLTLGLTRPEQNGVEHDALADARWHREMYREYHRQTP